MSEMDYSQVAVEEINELLDEMENLILKLENAPNDLTVVAAIFRAMHTIKGSAGMFGLDAIAQFTHHVETVLDKVRNGVLPVSQPLIDLTLASRDHIRCLVEAPSIHQEELDKGEAVIAALVKLDPHREQAPEAEPRQPDQPSDKKSQGPLDNAYLIHIEVRGQRIKEKPDSEPIFTALRQLGEYEIVDGEPYNQLGDGQQASDDQPAPPFWDIYFRTAIDLDAVQDALIFFENDFKVNVTALNADECGHLSHRPLGEILVDRGDISAEDLKQMLTKQKPKPLGEMLVEEKLVPKAKIRSALAQQEIVQSQKKELQKSGSRNIRVNADKLDQLVNLVGELVITQSTLLELSSELKEKKLYRPVKEIVRLTTELRDCTLNLRMLPIGTTFARFKRLVRDLSSELDKQVELVTEGAETELDKSVIERLNDPLVHLIRNSLDHGIEEPEERLARGKKAQGTIKLSAVHSGANVVLSIMDDGQGLDPKIIAEKAMEKGLIDSAAGMSEEEILRLIFAPGFSTAEKVSSVSGRGVGMDVVLSTIENELKGSVSLKSEKGKRTTVSISLPLTLAIIDGLLIRSGDTHFVLPLAQVEKCVELSKDDIKRAHGRQIISYHDEFVPYVRLRDFFVIPGKRPDLEQIVIVEVDEERLGLTVDEVIGGHQTVIKSLGWACRHAEGVSGSTILGSGEVALIVDLAAVNKEARNEAKHIT